jgi:hypothetical protein
MKRYRVKAILRNKDFTPIPSEVGVAVEVDYEKMTVLVTNDLAELTPGTGVFISELRARGQRTIICRFNDDDTDSRIVATMTEMQP